MVVPDPRSVFGAFVVLAPGVDPLAMHPDLAPRLLFDVGFLRSRLPEFGAPTLISIFRPGAGPTSLHGARFGSAGAVGICCADIGYAHDIMRVPKVVRAFLDLRALHNMLFPYGSGADGLPRSSFVFHEGDGTLQVGIGGSIVRDPGHELHAHVQINPRTFSS